MPKTIKTDREHFLADHPEAARLQKSQLAAITSRIGEYRTRIVPFARQTIDVANEAREVGLLIMEFEDTLPGKRLTEDFWQQLKDLFVDPRGQPILRENLEWFVKVARAVPEPFTNVLDVLKWTQPLLLASGDKQFKLEHERLPQVLHAPPNPLSLFRARFNYSETEGIWNQLQSDAAYCPGGRLRKDLRETLRVELEPARKLWDEIWRALEG